MKLREAVPSVTCCRSCHTRAVGSFFRAAAAAAAAAGKAENEEESKQVKRASERERTFPLLLLLRSLRFLSTTEPTKATSNQLNLKQLPSQQRQQPLQRGCASCKPILRPPFILLSFQFQFEAATDSEVQLSSIWTESSINTKEV